MTFAQIITSRRISEILHFTTNHGLVGILDSTTVLPRSTLPRAKRLEHIFDPTCKRRKDQAWLGHVNLSISQINNSLFGIAKDRWYRDSEKWWCVLSFRPEILTHNGVSFSTTNNMYSGTTRKEGPEGLIGLFADRIHQYSNSFVERKRDHPDHFPTCRQAEVLYPGPLSTAYIQRIYVATGTHKDLAESQINVLEHPKIVVSVDPEVFK